MGISNVGAEALYIAAAALEIHTQSEMAEPESLQSLYDSVNEQFERYNGEEVKEEAFMKRMWNMVEG